MSPSTASATGDPDEAATNTLDPLVPRPIDLPTVLPHAGSIDPEVGDIAKIFAAPDDQAEWDAWRSALQRWRDEARERLHYSGAIYEDPRTAWASRCFSVALTWLWDERLFDHDTQVFTVDRFLASTADFGGFDAVVLWHAYPVIGIDDRNQFDYYRDVPGLTDLIGQFHDRGLKVFIDYNPWDTGTRRAPHDDPEELALLVAELGVDGVFLDTMKEGGTDLIAALVGADQVLEGESRIQLARIEDHQLSWAQWFADSRAPGVLRAHWYERRHMLHHTRRWNRDHSDELQSSWMNGTGILVWDAVFGAWVGWNERDKATLRRMLSVQREHSKVFLQGEWTPLVPTTDAALAADVYASRWELGDTVLWTLVNRGDADYIGTVIDGLDPVTVPARGIAALGSSPRWSGDGGPPGPSGRGIETAAPAATFPARPLIRIHPGSALVPEVPAGAIELTPGDHELTMRYRSRETGLYDGALWVEEWKPLPPRLHAEREEIHTIRLGRVAVAEREVTRAEFEEFLGASGYQPVRAERLLVGSGEPATGVSLADARAYAGWAGARLPNEFEWQLAAQSPAFQRLKPLVWNLTESEHTDGITRFVILKGGNAAAIEGSDWYFDGGPRDADWVAKLLLTGLGMERSPSIGFRLAWDLP